MTTSSKYSNTHLTLAALCRDTSKEQTGSTETYETHIDDVIIMTVKRLETSSSGVSCDMSPCFTWTIIERADRPLTDPVGLHTPNSPKNLVHFKTNTFISVQLWQQVWMRPPLYGAVLTLAQVQPTTTLTYTGTRRYCFLPSSPTLLQSSLLRNILVCSMGTEL